MEENKIAVLIDGENISQNDIDCIFTEIKKDGRIIISRLYCGVDNLSRWREACNEYSIKIVTQNNYVSGKNTTDSSLIIDAMDILFDNVVDTFYILSSDSDFTGIIMRLKEGNKRVIGVGEQKTPKPIINACNRFIFIENLRPAKSKKSTSAKTKAKSKNESKSQSITDLDDIIKEIQDIVSEGKIQVSRIKEKLINIHPEFNLKNYGKTMKFSKFMEEIPGVKLTLDKDKTTFFAELKDSNQIYIKGNETESKKVKAKSNKNITPIEEIREFIVSLINNSKDKKINIGQLYSEIKKKYSDFALKNYGVNKIGKFIALYGNQFKYDNDKKPNYLMINL